MQAGDELRLAIHAINVEFAATCRTFDSGVASGISINSRCPQPQISADWVCATLKADHLLSILRPQEAWRECHHNEESAVARQIEL
jgi:hypothetical protein